MSISSSRQRREPLHLLDEMSGAGEAVGKSRNSGKKQKQTETDPPPLHVVYVSGGTDIAHTINEIKAALDAHGLRHASVIADATMGTSSDARKEAFLASLRKLFDGGQIGPDTRIIVQLHGGMDEGQYLMQATNVIDTLPWDELRDVLRKPSPYLQWKGDVIVGGCEAGALANTLPVDEGRYMLLAGKKSLAAGALREELQLLIRFMGKYVNKKHRMPSSEKIWDFLTQATGENIRRVDASGIKKIKAGQARVSKPMPGTTGKAALSEAQASQSAHRLVSKLIHGSASSVAAILRDHGAALAKDPMLKETPPLCWLPKGERDIPDKVAALFAAGFTDIRSDGHTILHIAVQRDLTELMRALLQQDINIDLPNRIGRTALHTASALGNESMVRLLLEHGANPQVVDNFGKTPADYAEEKGLADILRLLGQYAPKSTQAFADEDKENRRDANRN